MVSVLFILPVFSATRRRAEKEELSQSMAACGKDLLISEEAYI